MFERFTDRARRVMVLAQEEARGLDHRFIGSEHLLLGLLAEGEGVAARALTSLGVDLDTVRTEVQRVVRRAEGEPSGPPPFTPRAKKVIELSLRESLQLGSGYIGTEHLLLGLVREGDGVGTRVLEQLDVPLPTVRNRVIDILGGSGARGLEPPLCPHCSAGIQSNAATEAIAVDGNPLTVVYCKACGKTLTFIPGT